MQFHHKLKLTIKRLLIVNIFKKTMLLMALCFSFGALTSAVDSRNQLARTKCAGIDLTNEALKIVEETNNFINRSVGLLGSCGLFSLAHSRNHFEDKKDEDKKKYFDVEFKKLRDIFPELDKIESNLNILKDRIRMELEKTKDRGEILLNAEPTELEGWWVILTVKDRIRMALEKTKGRGMALEKTKGRATLLSETLKELEKTKGRATLLSETLKELEDWDTLMDMVTLLHNTFGEARKNTLKSVKKELIEVEGFKKIKELLNNANEEENLVKLLNMVQKKETKHKTRILNSAYADDSNGKLQEASDENIVTVCRGITFDIACHFIKHINNKPNELKNLIEYFDKKLKKTPGIL
jgi:hypothetical protein